MATYPSNKTYPQISGGLTWDQVKQKLESEGAFNVADLLHAYALYKAGIKTIDEIASAINNLDTDTIAVEIERRANFDDFIGFLVSVFNSDNLSADKASSILNSDNLSIDKAALILTDPNLGQAKFDSIWQNISDTRRNDMLDSYYWAVINPWCQEKYKEHINGGFETGDFTGWTTEGGYCSVKMDYVKEGTYACAVDRDSTARGDTRIYRTIKVPYRKDTNNKLYLHYWVKKWKDTKYDSDAKIKINGGVVYNIPYDNTWHERLEDITDYEGQTITIELYAHYNGIGNESCYVRWDDIYVVEGS